MIYYNRNKSNVCYVVALVAVLLLFVISTVIIIRVQTPRSVLLYNVNINIILLYVNIYIYIYIYIYIALENLKTLNTNF